MANEIRQFLRDHGISEVEAIIPDMAGIARGKIMPAEKFAEDEGMRLPGEHLPADGDRRLSARHRQGDEPGRDRHHPQGRRQDRAARALGGRAHRAGDPRLLLLRRPARRHGAARRAAPHPRDVREPRLGAGGGAGARVLPGRAQHRRGLSTQAAGGPFRPRRARPPELQHRGGQRVRSAVRRHVPVLRGPGHRDRHADPRGRRRADGDQPAARQCARSRRPGLPLQAHRARSGAAPQDVRHVHGQAACQGARQRHAHPPEHRRHQDEEEHLLAIPTARRRRCSSRTSPACRSTCRPRWRCWRRT